MAEIQIKFLPSMEKCFLDQTLCEKKALASVSMLRNERLSVQLGFYADERQNCELTLSGALVPYITMASVDSVPVTVTGKVDDDYLRGEAGLFPDLLTPVPAGEIVIAPAKQLKTLMLTIEHTDGIKAGEYTLKADVKTLEGAEASAELPVTVVDAMLPEQSLILTHWFHNDCIADWYGCEIFSEKHWELIGNYMEAAVRCGINMMFTPILTPPLDTAIGTERPTVQLVDIFAHEDGSYSFSYEKLERYIKLAQSKGMKYFEISHFFSQWGAIHAPKVVAKLDNGETKRIFGWDTDATSKEYTTFIRAFVSALLDELKKLGVDKVCRFHISDEPSEEQLGTYMAAKNVVKDLLSDYPVMDALSSFAFYEQGVVEAPVPATNHIEPFLEAKVPDLWTYYCCGQNELVSNRMVAMPGQRTRILGTQLYKFDIKGFLQWGFNFWYSCGSRRLINPYTDLCGDYWVPGGDTFQVYPGKDGKAVYSLHALLFYEALQDMRALQLLEKKIGREAVRCLIDFGCDEPMTFKSYPRKQEYILKLRETVNNMLK